MPAHDEFDNFFGDGDAPSTETTRADGRLLRVPLARLAPNLVNPRKDFGTEDDLTDFGKSLRRRQNQPCPVVSRSAYLKLWPNHAEKVGSVDYVLVSGERRYRGATAVGMVALNCVVNDEVAQDRKTFMEAVVSENVDRQNFDPVEEAYAVQALVAEFGSNRAVAQHFERVDGWVTQRVLLTHLAREVQDLVRKKEIPLEAARTLGKQARDNEWEAAKQLAWWQGEQERRVAAAAARAAARKATKEAAPSPPQPVVDPAPSPSFTAVKQDPAQSPVGQPAQDLAVKPMPVVIASQPRAAEEEPATAASLVSLPSQALEPAQRAPEPAGESDTAEVEDRPETKRFPYENGREAGNLLLFKMSPEERDVVFDMLARDREKRAAQTT